MAVVDPWILVLVEIAALHRWIRVVAKVLASTAEVVHPWILALAKVPCQPMGRSGAASRNLVLGGVLARTDGVLWL